MALPTPAFATNFNGNADDIVDSGTGNDVSVQNKVY